MGNKIKIVAHDGVFHADDIFAVATLLVYLEGKDVEIIRSRDAVVVETGDFVVDVGLVYDPSINRFDHHQIGGAGLRENGVPYASFGLVWKQFGEQICGSKEVFEKIDVTLVQPIDATDCGVKFIETKIEGLYPYDIGLFFNTFNKGFKEKNVDNTKIFIEVVGLAKTVLNREISKLQDLLSVRDIVKKTYEDSVDKRVIVFDQFYPAGEFLATHKEPLYTIFPNEDGLWVIKAVQDNSNDFVNRKDLPASWAGKNNEELEKETGIPGSVFCHTGRFIAVAKTKEAALRLAEIALKD